MILRETAFWENKIALTELNPARHLIARDSASPLEIYRVKDAAADRVDARLRGGMRPQSRERWRRGRAAQGVAEAQGLDRPSAGLSTETHEARDALGFSLQLIGISGQGDDTALAHNVIEDFEAGAVIADTGQDADALADTVTEIEVVIPLNRDRRVRFFCKLGQFWRVVTRHDKLLAGSMSVVEVAIIAIWLG